MNYSTNNNNNKKITLKIVILGDSGVGKTCVMNRYHTNIFSGQYKATIGADFITKDVIITDEYGISHVVTLQIWDTAGQERFQSLGQSFYRGSDAAILIYDITDPLSLQHLNHWKNEFIQQVYGQNVVPLMHNDVSKFPFIVVGNKYDKDKVGRKIPIHRAEEWCRTAAQEMTSTSNSYSEMSLPHYETSAKTGWNVEEIFQKIATLAYHYEQYKRVTQQSTSPQLFIPPPPSNEYVDLNRQYSNNENNNNNHTNRNNNNTCC